MNKSIAVVTLTALLMSGTAYAKGVSGGGQMHYSGNAQTHGFVSKTGFVKERTDEEDQMGKDKAQAEDADQKDEGDETSDDDQDDTDATREDTGAK